MLFYRILFFIIISIMSFSATAAEKLTKVPTPPLEQLVKQLREGNYVIFIRHAKTNRKESDANNGDFSTCKKQRNLNDVGRKQAEIIGKAFVSKKIPVGVVHSSPYCRATDTAKLAFNKFLISNHLRYLSLAKPQDKQKIKDGVKHLLSVAPAKGKNNILISHTSNLKEAAGIWPREPAVAVIFKPMAQGKFQVVGKIEPSQWQSLLK